MSKLMNGLGIKCTEGNWEEKYLKLSNYKKNKKIDFKFILKNNGVEDTFWALRTQEKIKVLPILADIAESVLYIYENKYPKDMRVRDYIQSIRDFVEGKITEEELSVLKNATYAAYNAAYNATYAAYNAVYNAAYAAYNAAYNAAYAADAAYATGRKLQWKKNQEILERYL
jgi:hypothetical protein